MPLTPSALSPQSPRPRTVLLVDDEADILESLGDLLSASLPDIKVERAASGEDALALMGKTTVDLILSDYKMPGLNGLQFLEKARQMAPNVPRLLMTAFPDMEVAIAAINDARIETFFTKPLDPDRVVDVVSEVLKGRQAQSMRDQALARALDEARRRGGPSA